MSDDPKFDVWHALWTVRQECERGRFGSPDYDITLDHLYDTAEVGLDKLDALIPGPLPVTVDDEHASPVTGWVMRLPEEMGGFWVARDPWPVSLDDPPTVDDVERLAALARDWQGYGRRAVANRHGQAQAQQSRSARYAIARWWAEAYRVVLEAEAAS